MARFALPVVITSLFQGIANACFPRQCVECGVEGSLLCTVCTQEFHRPLRMHANVPNEFIERADASFSYGAPVIRNLLQAYKYSGDRQGMDVLAVLAQEMVGKHVRSGAWSNVSLMCPVPLAPRKEAERGFNQAQGIAQMIADVLQIPVEHALHRAAGKAQAKKGKEERAALVQLQPFRCTDPLRVEGKHILLIDDVWTTGSTATAAAMALRDSGAKSVSVYTLAYGNPT